MLIDNFYKLISSDENEIVVKLSSSEHPIFKAHFPSNPILPGFMHFEIISKIFNVEIDRIRKAKFNEIVRPNEILKYIKNNNRYSVFVNEKQVATFSL